MQSYESHNRQWRSANARRGNGVCQRIGYILDYESPRKHASSIVAWKALRWKLIFLRMDPWSKPNLIKNGIRILFNTENFVPIVVPGLSSSSSGSSSTSKTPSRQESHSSSSSSASSSSPTVSEIQIREREDGMNNDTSSKGVNFG